MGSALVLGDRGSGLTTFLGLLYTAQVRYGTEASDRFRFHADRESIRSLQGIYTALGEGKFPQDEIDWEQRPLAFLLGFRRSGLRPRARSEESGAFDVIQLRVGGLSPEEIAELGNHETILDGNFRSMVRSPILLILLDATRLPLAGPDSLPGGAAVRYDHTLARTLAVVAGFVGSERARRDRQLFPLFVVTKSDRLADNVRRQLRAPEGPAEEWDEASRSETGEALLRTYFPETRRYLQSPEPPGLRVAPPGWFFSSVRLASPANGEPRISRRERTPLGGWEPEYPFEEYRRLLDRLGALAHRLPSEPTT
jgi:hypothetical protein